MPKAMARHASSQGGGVTPCAASAIKVVAQQVTLVVSAFRHGQCGADVIADIEVPPAALDELPVEQRWRAVGIAKEVAHVGITVDDTPRLCCHLGGGAGDETR